MVKEVTPWRAVNSSTRRVEERDLTKSREVQPLITFGIFNLTPPAAQELPHGRDLRPLDHAAQKNDQVREEVTAPVVTTEGGDPKVPTSPVADTASSLETGSSESGTQVTDPIQTVIHPSTLSGNPGDPVSVEKDTNPIAPPVLPLSP